MLVALRALLGALGVSAVLICLSVMLLGPAATAYAFERAYDTLTGWRGPFSPAWPPTMDSELRFYAPLFGAYGGVLLVVANRYSKYGALVPWLAGVFFCGGVGRAISWLAVGAPHPLFILLMSVELALPPVLIGLWFASRARPR